MFKHILCFQIAKKKEIFRQEIEDFLEKQKEFKEAEKHTEEIEKKLTEIYRRSKQKVEQMRKEKEQEVSNFKCNSSSSCIYLNIGSLFLEYWSFTSFFIITATAVTSFLQILNESLNKKEKIRDYLAQLKQRKGDEENALRKKATAEKEAM